MILYPRWRRITARFIAASLLAVAPAQAQENSKEYLVKAAFLYNFVKFVEWPGDLAVSKRKSINICVIGTNVLAPAANVFKQASTPALELRLTETSLQQAKECHIAYISRSEAGRLAEISAALKAAPVLTVSDIEGFADRYGIVGFILMEGKVKVVVNTASAAAAGLRVDAQLLEIASRVIRE